MEMQSAHSLAQPDSAAARAGVAANVVAALTGVLALGTALLAIGHSGIPIPVVSALGPGGSRAVIPAAVAFSIVTAAAAALTVGALRRRTWAWALGLVLHTFVVVGAAVPYRGLGSLVGIIISVATLGVLVSKPGRAAFLPSSR